MIHPDSPMAQTIHGTFRAMEVKQAQWQDEIGFGEEGHRLRADLAASERFFDKNPSAQKNPDHEEHRVNAVARANLRNYYLSKLALIMTEVAEAIEEVRNGHAMDETYHSGDFSDHSKPMKPEGVPSELADVVIRIWSLCGEAGIDLGPMIVEKLNYNQTRAQKHGGKEI